MKGKTKKYIFLEHTADIKIKSFGKNLNEIFENFALAVSEYLSRGEKIKNIKKKKITVKGEDNESLLYNFLDELIYLLDAKNFVVSKAKATTFKKGSTSPNEIILEAEVYGDSASQYDDLDHIKAATYAEMYIKQKKDNSWEAQVVLDV